MEHLFFRETPNGKRVTVTPTVPDRPLFAINYGVGSTLVVINNFTVELDGKLHVDFTQGHDVMLSDGPDGIWYIVAEPSIGGRRRRLLSMPAAEINERYGEVVGRYRQVGGGIVSDSIESLNDFCPVEPMAIDTRLRIALGRFEQYLGSDLTAADRELIHTTTIALQAIGGDVTMPRHHVLQTIRLFVGEMEQTTMDNAEIDHARDAYADLCRQWGVLHPGGHHAEPQPRPVHASALAAHLATLIEFHHDDDRDEQHADPILEAYHPPELSSLRLKTESGRQFMVSVVELPA